MRPLFDTDGVGWSGDAPVDEVFTLHTPGFDDIIDAALVQDRFRGALATWGREGGAPIQLRYGGLADTNDFGGGNDDHNISHRGGTTLSSALAVARTTAAGGAIVDCDIRIYQRNLFGTIDWTATAIGANDGDNDV